MGLRTFLILMTAVAVISDSLLHPFYPQYFSSVFGVDDARHVGAYVAASAFVVIVTFPLWALIAKRVDVLKLLIFTQLMTLALSLACSSAPSLLYFWVFSMLTMLFKASYLLIYPYVMSIEDKTGHTATVGLLALAVHFGNITSSLLAGAVFEYLEARLLFVAMAAGDALQILLCLYMVRRTRSAVAEEAEPAATETPLPKGFVLKLGGVMFVLYFSAYLSDPFFSLYWEEVAHNQSKLWSGVVFAIPGLTALLGIWVNSRRSTPDHPAHGIAQAIAFGAVGLALQLTGNVWLLVLGRVLYGWALFQSLVRLDLLLFRLSQPGAYAVDFSKLNLFQGVGALVASLAAGELVSSVGLRAPFVVATFGFAVGLVLYSKVLHHETAALPNDEPEPLAPAA